jgi:hypothetical protein
MSTENTTSKLDRVVAQAQQARQEREQSYRGKALKMYPWVCGRCAREFNQKNLQELTVHHRDHNHDNNPPDGSNWELLCVYCHDNEHSRHTDSAYGDVANETETSGATYHPFAGLDELIKKKK